MRTLSWAAACGLRLRRQHLLDRSGPTGVTAVARAMCGVHAQLQAAAELGLATRIDGLSQAGIAAELWERRTLLRIPSIRGTIHLLPAEDAPIWLAAARAGHDERAEARRLAYLGITAAQQETMLAAIVDSLDGRALTLRELGEAVVGRAGDFAARGRISAFGGEWQLWRSAVYAAGRAGLLCFGPSRGREMTYVRPDQWAPGWRKVDPGEALAMVARWYLRSFGPATAADLARYLGVAPRLARQALAGLAGELETVNLEGESRLVLAGQPLEAGAPASVRLLPHFDSYLLGSHPRARLFAAFTERGIPIGGGGNLPVLLVNGEVAGLWRRSLRGARAEVVVDSFRPLGRAQEAELEREVERMAAFTGVPTALARGAIEARPHL